MRLKRCIVILAFLLLVSNDYSKAQALRDHVGREFFVVFGPNTGGQAGVETENRLQLVLISAEPAHVVVEIPGLSFDRSLIIEPHRSIRVELPNGNDNNPTAALERVETVAPGMAVHVTSNVDITVFGLAHKTYSTDAFLVLPVDALGTEYRMLSYKASHIGQGQPLPGQMMIAAIEDQTTVALTPSCQTSTGRDSSKTYSVDLQRGDAYLVQTDASPWSDLSGSKISSNKPIAVFGSHHRTAIPQNALLYDGSLPSRDHLIEQLPPVTACGDTFIVVPFFSAQRSDLVRIIATEDATLLEINGTQVTPLNDGGMFEVTSIGSPMTIYSSKPVLVGQYMGTTMGRLSDNTFPSFGDPSLLVVPPVEQYLSEHRFHCYPADYAYATIILPAEAYTTTMLDSIPIDIVTAVPGTNYVIYTRRIYEGHHTVHSSMPVGVMVYGMDDVSSWAMPAGMGVEPGGMTRSAVRSSFGATENSVLMINGSLVIRSDDQAAHTIAIFDLLGRPVTIHHFTAGKPISIDVSRYARGLYSYGLTSEGSTGRARMTGTFMIP